MLTATKKKQRRKNIGFSIAVIFAFMPLVLLLLIIDARWFGYAAAAIIITAFVLLRTSTLWRKWRIIVFWLLALTLTFMVAVLSRPSLSVSFRGTLVRESVRLAMQHPILHGDGLFSAGAQYADGESTWKASDGYTLTKYEAGDLPLEMLTCDEGSADKLILQFHGGGYVIRFMDIYRDTAVRYCDHAKGASVLSVDYRIAPEHTFPAALDDALTAWDWLLKQGYQEENIVVVGDSAGGNLALALVAKLRDADRKLPAGLICMSPWADLQCDGDSWNYNCCNDPMFGEPHGDELEDSKLMCAYAGEMALDDKFLSPLYGTFEDFPPMLIQVGTYEVLESDAVGVYEKAQAAGVDVRLTRYEGMFHTFQLFGDLFPESAAAWDEVEAFLAQRLFSDAQG